MKLLILWLMILIIILAGGMDYRYTYDKDGLLLTKKASGRTLLAYTYNELGRKTGQTDYYEYEGHGIWGLTARIIKSLGY